jgi:hypothetical protein
MKWVFSAFVVLWSLRAIEGPASADVVQSSTLHPVFKDAFVGNYVGMVRFFRDPRGAVAGVTLNRNSARGVHFERIKRAG